MPKRTWLSAIRRLGWGLLVGVAVASLPELANWLNNVALLLMGEILGWPGAIVALALGGWNARPFTTALYYSTNVAVYVGLTYFLLSVRVRRTLRNKVRSGLTE